MRMPRSPLFLALFTAAALSGCGSDDSAKKAKAPDNKAAPAAARQASANASAEEVAKEARGKIKCPAPIATPARAAGQPVDDVVGVRPGLTYDEAVNVVLCTNDLLVANQDKSRGFNIQTYGQDVRQGFYGVFAQERVQRTSKEILRDMQDSAMARGTNRLVRDVLPGQAKWYVGTIGMPGQERVVNAAREEWFATDRNPTVASVQDALIKKYGPPTDASNIARDGYRTLRWAYDPLGRLITETSPLYNQCHGPTSVTQGVSLSPDCGIVVAAYIQALRENPDLAEHIRVGVVDQARGYEAVTATEQALQQAEEVRRAKQVQEASKNADSPTL